MDDVIDRLLRAYGRELELYDEIADLARDGARIVRERRSLEELNELNRRKQERLREVERVERRVAADKEAWMQRGRDHARSRELDGVLANLTATIENILASERETDHWILTGAGLEPSPSQVA